MKTLYKRHTSPSVKEGKNLNQNIEKSYLIEHEEGHKMLVHNGLNITSENIKDFISIKKEILKRRRAEHFLYLSISLCISLVFVILAFEWKSPEQLSVVAFSGPSTSFEELMEVPVTEQVVAPPPPSVEQPRIIEVSDEKIIEDLDMDLDIDVSEGDRIVEPTATENIVMEQKIPEEVAEEVFNIVEEQPSPVGGMKAFYGFAAENLEYPSIAKRSGIQGRVFVEFIVEKDGSLTDVHVVRGIGSGCDEEAIRVLSIAPKWNPGKQRGKPVRVKMVLPIYFKLVQ